MKMRHLEVYKLENVPDHLRHEIHSLIAQLNDLMQSAKIYDKHEANVVLAAMSFLYATLIHHYISDDLEAKKTAAAKYAWGLIKNIELVSGIKILDKEDDTR